MVYKFSKEVTDGTADMKDVLGGKGAGLAGMASAGLPVPPGFTLPTSECLAYLAAPNKYEMSTLMVHVLAHMHWLKDQFGYMPLVSVRSGARVSMPGMMDTILNVGITDETMQYWMDKIGERAALDSYRRLIQMYGCVVKGIESANFEEILTHVKQRAKVATDSELNVDQMSSVVHLFMDEYQNQTGSKFPSALEAQLEGAIKAVFESWNNDRACVYRKMNGYPEDWGTAVTVQSMVFGNLNDKSCSGVLFTRNPSTGDNKIVGEFLPNAQGEDVVAGIRTPLPLANMKAWNADVLEQICNFAGFLEETYKDMQDVEFTVQDGELFILQTRNAKRSAQSAFKVAFDLFQEEIITKEEMIERVTGQQFLVLTRPMIDPKFKVDPHLSGIPAGGTLVTGVAVFSNAEAVEKAKIGKPVILIAHETTPDDIEGMNASVGILTATGGLTSHAAVVARGMNKTCVVGCTSMKVNGTYAAITGADVSTIYKGDTVTMDGLTGRVWVSVEVPVTEACITEEAQQLVDEALADQNLLVYGTTEEEAVGGQIHFPTSVFEEKGGLNIADMAQSMQKLLDAGITIVADLSPKTEVYSKHDNMIEFMAVPPMAEKDMMALKKEVLVKLKAKKGQLQALEGDGMYPSIQGQLTKAGIEIIPKAKTVADILAAKSYVRLTDAVVSSAFGGVQAVKDFMDVMKQAGREVKLLPPPELKMSALFRILGVKKLITS